MTYQIIPFSSFIEEENVFYTSPSLHDLENLLPGQHVKLVFKVDDSFNSGYELLWLNVSWIEGKNFQGKLVDGSNMSDEMPQGMTVHFHESDILMIW